MIAARRWALLVGIAGLAGGAFAQSDSCASATLVTQGTYAGSTVGSLPEGDTTCGASGQSPDVWYRYAPAEDCSLVVDTCGSSYDTVLSVHTGCPGTAGNTLACNDDACGLSSRVQLAAAAGTTYWIRVSGYQGASGAFALRVACNGPEASDCGLAPDIGAGAFSGSTIGAGNDGAADCGQSAAAPDVWYRYTPGETCTQRIELCGSSYDTVLSVHTGCPGTAANQLACNDDSCGLSSMVEFLGEAGHAYLIRVSGYNGASGAFVMSVGPRCAPAAADACANAAPVSPGQSLVNILGATPDGGASCDPGAAQADGWVSYTPGDERDVRINTCGSGFDTVLSVHTACPGTPANEVACSDNWCGTGSFVNFLAQAGTTYYVRVAGANGARGTAQLQLLADAPGTGGADAYVGELSSLTQLGRSGDIISAVSDTPLCNAGNVPLETIHNPDPRHPFFGFNMYRVTGGRIEQIGQSWAKHMQGAAQGDECGFGCTAYPDGTHLGIGCSDTYSAGFNAIQTNMGPRSEINPWTGAFTYAGSYMSNPNPPPDTAVSRRLQMHDADLNPAAHPGAVFLIEQYTLAHDDSNHMNSIAREAASISGAPGGTWTFNIAGGNTINGPAINSWSGATLSTIQGANDGRCILGVKVTDLGNGQWHYEYALYNHDMDRGVRTFSIPVGPGTGVSNIGFHAVESHDEPFNNQPWSAARDADVLTWTTAAFNPADDSNPLRWGTLYNFWFDADAPPVDSAATLGLYKPGDPGELSGATLAPATPCVADFNHSGGTPDDADAAAFFGAWSDGDASADVNASGGAPDDADIAYFFARWTDGC